MNNDGLRLLPRLEQLIQVLDLVERIATAPVHQADIGVREVLAVELVCGAGVEQHVGEACHRDEGFDGVLAHRGLGQRNAARRTPDAVTGAIAKTKTTTRQADLAQHRRQGNRGPIRLFAVIGTLNGPTHRDHRALRRHAPGQRTNGLGGNIRKSRSP